MFPSINVAGWTKLGDGTCFADLNEEYPHRINKTWVIADLATAKKACEANTACAGIHYDAGGCVGAGAGRAGCQPGTGERAA